MHSAVAIQNHPARPSNAASYLREPLAAIEGLIVLAAWMAQYCVDLIETHEIQIVGSSKKQAAARARHAVHFIQRTLRIGHQLDRLATNHHVKGTVCEGQSLRITLNQPVAKRLRTAFS